MIDPQKLFEITMEAKAGVPDINKTVMVVTDDEFTETLSGHKTDDNLLLVAVLPSYNGFGEEDETGTQTYMQFFVLKKVDYKSFKNNDEYIAVFQETLEATKLFLEKMFANAGLCAEEQFQFGWNIRPVSRKSQCNGYEIQLDSKAFADLILN